MGDVGVAQLAGQLHDPLPLEEVGGRVEQQALGVEAVAAGAAGFLLVVLERLRRAGVHDEAHVGSVDAHAEGDGGDDDVGALVDEGVLVARALVVGQAGVVGHRLVAGVGQRRRRLVDVLARDAVDDAGLAAVRGHHRSSCCSRDRRGRTR